MNLPSPNLPVFAPSLLAADHADLRSGLAEIESCRLKWVHLDIMDGHFVPNLSFGPQTVSDLRTGSSLFFDTHLMLEQPQRFIDSFIEAGSDLISIHIETATAIADVFASIKERSKQCGLVINPDTAPEMAEPYLDCVDLVLVMTVNPGFGGQDFREDVLPKLERLARWRDSRSLQFRLQVDGGIDVERARLCSCFGADTFVAGTAFFKAESRSAFAEEILSSV